MAQTKWWLVCYDVRDEVRLRKCAKHMEGYGRRIQYSVFRCWLTGRAAERLRWELTRILTDDDDVMLIPVCRYCAENIRGIRGNDKASRWPERPPRHSIV